MNDSWSPQSCIEQAADIPTKFSDYSIQCTDQPSSTNGCTVVNGVSVCESYFAPSPVAGISPLCRRVQVSVDDESYKGIEIRPAKCLKRTLPVASCRQNVPKPMIKVNAFVLPIPMTVDCKPAIQSAWYPILCRVVLRPVSYSDDYAIY